MGEAKMAFWEGCGKAACPARAYRTRIILNLSAASCSWERVCGGCCVREPGVLMIGIQSIRFLAVAALAGLMAVSVAEAQAPRPADTNSLAGKPAPDFELQTLDGKKVKLSDMRGDVVVLDFWATWCPPCRKAMPHLYAVATNKALAERGLKVLAVNARETNDKVEKYLEENNFAFTVPMDREGKVMTNYLVRGIPTTVVVGRDGEIKNVFIGYGEGSDKKLDDAIEQALKQERPK